MVKISYDLIGALMIAGGTTGLMYDAFVSGTNIDTYSMIALGGGFSLWFWSLNSEEREKKKHSQLEKEIIGFEDLNRSND